MLAALHQVSVLDLGLSIHPVLAQVNFQLGPAVILGLSLAGAGAGLYLLRSMRPELARDYDIFFSAIGLLCGGILFFNGWRLDPILMFGQFLTGGSAVFFAFESIRLRSITTEQARRGGGRESFVDDEREYSNDRVYRAELDEIEPFMEDRPPVRRIRGSRDSEPSDNAAYRDSYSQDSYTRDSYPSSTRPSRQSSSRQSSSRRSSRSARSDSGATASYESESGYGTTNSAYGSDGDERSSSSSYTAPGYASRRSSREETPPKNSRRSSSRQRSSPSRDAYYDDEPPAQRRARSSRNRDASRDERTSRPQNDDYVDYKPISNYSDSSSSAYGSRRPSSDYDDEWGAS